MRCKTADPSSRRRRALPPGQPWDAVSALKPVVKACQAEGSLVIGQLTNGGRQTSQDINAEPYSSSSEQCPPMGGMVFNKPRPMTIAEIDTLVESFAYAAKVLYDAGADGAQLHGAHGYLLSQFLSARVNKRTDNYGGAAARIECCRQTSTYERPPPSSLPGSLENRARIILRIIDAIKERVPKDFLLSIKMNSADFSEGGLTDEESRTVASWLDAKGLDLIELSGGTYEQTGFEHKKESTKAREGFFVEFSEQMKPLIKEARIAVTGGFRSADAMNKALQDGATDIIGLARPLTAEPYLCREIIEGKKTKAMDNKVVRRPAVPLTPRLLADPLCCPSRTPASRRLRPSSRLARSRSVSRSPTSATRRWRRRRSSLPPARSRRPRSLSRTRTPARTGAYLPSLLFNPPLLATTDRLLLIFDSGNEKKDGSHL